MDRAMTAPPVKGACDVRSGSSQRPGSIGDPSAETAEGTFSPRLTIRFRFMDSTRALANTRPARPPPGGGFPPQTVEQQVSRLPTCLLKKWLDECMCVGNFHLRSSSRQPREQFSCPRGTSVVPWDRRRTRPIGPNEGSSSLYERCLDPTNARWLSPPARMDPDHSDAAKVNGIPPRSDHGQSRDRQLQRRDSTADWRHIHRKSGSLRPNTG